MKLVIMAVKEFLKRRHLGLHVLEVTKAVEHAEPLRLDVSVDLRRMRIAWLVRVHVMANVRIRPCKRRANETISAENRANVNPPLRWIPSVVTDVTMESDGDAKATRQEVDEEDDQPLCHGAREQQADQPNMGNDLQEKEVHVALLLFFVFMANYSRSS